METALIIEDNPDNMLLISDILENHGVKILQAETGEQGLQMAETHLPSYIILDIQLPDIIGDEVLKRIRTSSSIEHIPVIAMTSYAMAGDRERLLRMGCNGYIEKPINPAIVMDQINSAIKDSP